MKNYIPETPRNLFFENYLTLFVYTFGGLAHLARALRWQRRGDRFEPDILHKIETLVNLVFTRVFILYAILSFRGTRNRTSLSTKIVEFRV